MLYSNLIVLSVNLSSIANVSCIISVRYSRLKLMCAMGLIIINCFGCCVRIFPRKLWWMLCGLWKDGMIRCWRYWSILRNFSMLSIYPLSMANTWTLYCRKFSTIAISIKHPSLKSTNTSKPKTQKIIAHYKNPQSRSSTNYYSTTWLQKTQ